MKKVHKTLKIAVMAGKGGSGKTTLALNTAVALAATGLSTVVLDLDPQKSLANLASVRPSEGVADITVRAIAASGVPGAVKALTDAMVDIIIFDLPPHTEASSLAVASVADLIVIPAQPAPLDLLGIAPTVQLIRSRPGLIDRAVSVIQGASPRLGGDAQAQQAGEWIRTRYGIPCLGVMYRRKGFADSVGAGLSMAEAYPDSKGAAESRELAMSILKRARA